MSRELRIQAEVGRRLRDVIGRAHEGHALKVNSKFNWSEGDAVIHESDEDFARAHRPKKHHADTHRAMTAKGIEDPVAASMVPPSLGEFIRGGGR